MFAHNRELVNVPVKALLTVCDQITIIRTHHVWQIEDVSCMVSPIAVLTMVVYTFFKSLMRALQLMKNVV